MAITLTQAIEGFLLEKHAQQLSPHTIADYSNAYRKLQRWLQDDPPLAAITAAQIRRFLAELGTVPQPRPGVARRPPRPLSKKTVLNIHIALSALWTWAVREGFADRHILRDIPRPRPERRAIDPFTEQDLRALLEACDRTRPYGRPGKRTCANARPTALRDRAILYLLLDTGIRSAELCELAICDADLKNRKIKVEGKGSRERVIPISPRTAKTLWRYLATRPDERLNAPLILTQDGRPYSGQALLLLMRSLGRRAGVPKCHPHRFRHTFAIQFLRNRGDIFSLQRLLGHSTLEMVKRYLKLAQADVESAHRRASPVDNWNL